MHHRCALAQFVGEVHTDEGCKVHTIHHIMYRHHNIAIDSAEVLAKKPARLFPGTEYDLFDSKVLHT